MKRCYFLCTGNSARSQMAEAFAKKYLPAGWEIQSAGIEMHGLNPLAVLAMSEIGIDISQQFSKLIDHDYLMSCDLIVTLCGDARDRCPITPPSIKKAHWDLIDPAAASGSEADKMRVFRKTRDEIDRRVQGLAREMTQSTEDSL